MAPRPPRNPQRALAIAEQRIAEEAQARTGKLDLNGLGLDELPDSLFTLTHLRELDLGCNWSRDNAEPNRLDAQKEALGKLIRLEVLSVNRSDLTSLVTFQALRSLRSLNCFSTKVADIAPLEKCINLQSLSCFGTQVADITPLEKCINLQSLHCSSTQVADIAPLEKCINLRSLHCSSTQVADITPLEKCINLRSLDCSGTQVADITPLEKCINLQSLSCFGTQVADITPLEKCINLQSLHCSGTQVADITPLEKCINLQTLNCFRTQVADITPLEKCINLRFLDCSGTQVADIAPLEKCINLRSLNCSSTQIADIAPLEKCINLQSLDCSDTQVADIAPLEKCINLQSFNCSSTQVANIAPLEKCINLQSLNCSSTQIADIAPLEKCINLQSLDCSDTQVADIAPLEKCINLWSLNYSFCQLHSLPAEILKLPALRRLYLFDTVIPQIPPAGVLSTSWDDNCLHRVRAHFADLAAEVALLPSVKLLLIGNGGAGKTQVARRLAGEAFDPVWNSTHGIEIGRAVLPGDPEVQLHIWDFGGQDIYHGAHALFLTTPAVIAAVWATDTEADKTHRYGGLEFRNQPLPYWIDVARHQGHAHSPLLVVQTKCDRPEHEVLHVPVADGQLDDRPYAKPCHVSAKTGRGFGGLRDVLADAVAWLREPERMGVPRIGAGRLRVQRRLEALRDADQTLPPGQRRHRLLTLGDFAALCAEEGGVSSPDALLTYLDAEGTVLYRPGLFQDRIVLDQNWALEAIYAVFERDSGVLSEIRRTNGRFTRTLLGRFVWQAHSPKDQNLFIGLMQSCGMCFTHRSFDDGEIVEYIAPDLLPDRAASRLAGLWDEEQAGEAAVFRYPLLHGGLIRTIMAGVGERAGPDALYWQGGLWGFETNTQSRLLIEQRMTGPWTGEIHVRTQRGRAADLLGQLVELVERAEHRIGLRHAAAERTSTRPRDEETRDMSFSPPPAVETGWYVSYAWGDTTPEGQARESVVNDLCAAARAKGRTILRDRDVLGLGDDIPAFMRRIGGGSRVFVILSDKYLRSPYCMFELSEIWRTSREKKDFLDRVRVYALPDARIWTIKDRIALAVHWKQEFEALDSQVREHGATILGAYDHDQLRLMDTFHKQVGDILAAIATTIQPRSFEELERSGLTD